MKDSNVVCVAEAAGCFAALAKGLRKEFAPSARAMVSNLLDKLKDKNTAVCTQSAQALLAIHRCGQFGTILMHVLFQVLYSSGTESWPHTYAYALVVHSSCKCASGPCRYCVTLVDMADDLTASIGHKNPKQKSESLRILKVKTCLTLHAWSTQGFANAILRCIVVICRNVFKAQPRMQPPSRTPCFCHLLLRLQMMLPQTSGNQPCSSW